MLGAAPAPRPLEAGAAQARAPEHAETSQLDSFKEARGFLRCLNWPAQRARALNVSAPMD